MDLGPSRILAKCGTSFAEKVFAPTPIMLEVGSDFSPLFEGWRQDTMLPRAEKALHEMREAIWKKWGVRVPGVRVRAKGDPANEICIQIHEITVEQEVVPPQQKHHLDYFIEKLRGIIEANLADFIGIQDVSMLLESQEWGAPADPQVALSRIINQDSSLLVILVICLRKLIQEKIPIKPLEVLMEGCVRGHEKQLPILEIAESLRALPEIRDHLPGNEVGNVFIEIGSVFETQIRTHITLEFGIPRLKLSWNDTQIAAGLLREVINTEQRSVFVVRDPALRPYLRAFLDVENSEVPILAWRELRPELQAQISRTIEWRGS